MADYAVRRMPRHEICRLRGLDTHLTRWGPESGSTAPVVLLHGWQDTGDTFQFMVDAFAGELPLLAPDWRGFGRSAIPEDGYWFADYLADLDALLDRVSPGAPVSLVGHSMGGNIASLYAGLRPGRVKTLVNLEGFGLPRAATSDALEQMRKWMDQVKIASTAKSYDSLEQLTNIIALRYPRFSPEQSDFVSRAWSRQGDDGRRYLLGDPRHRRDSPQLYRRDDAEAIWARIEARMLLVLARQSEYLPRLGPDGTDEALRRAFPRTELVHVEEAGHMVHIEKAGEVALLVENFLAA